MVGLLICIDLLILGTKKSVILGSGSGPLFEILEGNDLDDTETLTPSLETQTKLEVGVDPD